MIAFRNQEFDINIHVYCEPDTNTCSRGGAVIFGPTFVCSSCEQNMFRYSVI